MPRQALAAVLSGVIALRVGLGIVGAGAVLNELHGLALACLFVAAVTDGVDGHLARRIAGRSACSLYADPVADFLYVVLAFAAFAVQGTHPWWLVWLIVAMGAQFVITSGAAGPVYDPLGKVYGIALFGAIGASLVWPHPPALRVVRLGILSMTALTLISRGTMLVRRRYLSARADPDKSS